MRPVFRSVLAPIFSLGLIMLGQGFFTTFISMKLTATGYSYSITGLVNSCYYLGMMLGGIYIEKFMKKIGHIKAFSAFAALTAASICLQGLALHIVSWMTLRFLAGVFAAGIFIVIESWLLLLSTSKTRGVLLAFYMVALYAAQAMGQFFINLTNLDSSSAFLISIFLSSLSIVPLCLMKSESPQILSEPSLLNIFHISKTAFFGVFGCFLSGMVLSAFYSLGPVFGQKSGFSILQVSEIMGFTIFGGLALQWPIGKLSDIISRKKVLLMVSVALLIISTVLFLDFEMPFAYLIILCVLFGGFSFTLYPLGIAHTCDQFHEGKIISITCSLLIVYGIGAILGPILAPLPMEFLAPSALFLYVAILSFLLSLAFFIPSKKHKIKEESQNEYVAMPRTTPLASYLDPRQEDKKSAKEDTH